MVTRLFLTIIINPIKTKQFFLTVCLLIVSMAASAVTINKALLQHNGEVTLFDGNDMQLAEYTAVDGDTIYLTLGTFKPFTVNKKITVRGTGETSIIDGSVDISIPGSQKLTSPVLETLAVSGNVTVKADVNDLILRKCKVASVTFSGNIDGGVIDRCYITNTLTLTSYIKGLTVVNTKIYSVKANNGATNNTTFVNCNFYDLFTDYFAGTIINSIIQNRHGQTLSSTVLINTVINRYNLLIGSSSITQNCKFVNTQDYVSSSCNCTPDNSYLGTDGTIVGIYGGDTPYTLVPSVPKVTSSDLDLDNVNKVLNVKLTVSPQ